MRLSAVEINDNKFNSVQFIQDCETGARILGKKPKGINPLYVNEKTQYFGTFPFIEKGKEFSIFVGWDIDGVIEELDRIPLSNEPIHPSGLIHAVIHNESERSIDEDFESEYDEGFGVKISQEEDECEEKFSPDCFSKLYGKPTIFQSVRSRLEPILVAGYKQVLQIDGQQLADEADDNDLIDPSVLHVFVKPPYKDNDFLFFLQS